MRRRSVRVAVGAGALLTLAACGSTVQLPQGGIAASQGDLSSLDGLGLGPQPSNDPLAGGGASLGSGATADPTASALPSDEATVAGETSGSSSGGSSQSGSPSKSSRGVTATTVTIGIADSDLNSFTSNLGLNAVATGDTRAQAAVLVNDINKRGGLAGRKIKLVWYRANTATQLSNQSSVSQAACSAWTQDARAFAVVGPIGLTVDETLLSCLAKADTPLVGVANAWGLDSEFFSQSFFTKYPSFMNIGAMRSETFYKLAVQRLVARNFFEPWDTINGAPSKTKTPVKIGVVVTDNINGRATLAAIKTELAKYGMKPADVIFKSDAGIAQRSAEGQNATLRFRSAGITHVFGLINSNTAEQQRYRPRYFMHQEPAVLGANAPKGQLNGAMGESYIPALDADRDPGPPTSATTRCLNLMKAAGQQPAPGATTWSMESLCDGFFFLEAAVKKNPELTTAGLINGFESLGTGVQSAVTWTSLFSPKEHSSVNGLRDLAYGGPCKCFYYPDSRTYK